MFETNDSGRLEESPFFPPQPGSHRWAYVALTSNHEWFFVTYDVVQDETVHTQQLLIPGPQYLLGLTSRDGPDEAVREVQLVSPPWLNEDGAWRMEPLTGIRIVGRRFCYELSDGNFYPSELAEQPSKIMWRSEGRSDG
ncbi:hypothetical protein PPUJ13061_43260 [Pseudomonas putida]|uniref:hypothetical protein n=1 Tax=Pseudomonas TaxID=286 RepID=UPI000E0DAF90|nr:MULTISPECIES: hypothetical protein [Pseudomonas]MBC3422233.1 hypothetical protein [Pseudomonas sp. RW3S2]WQE55648.1 hypothetical protein U0028_08250 [Pseudomonas putida]GLO04425.1 hypothetical protein PPUJ13061_43260 [Pseudomonas putida]HDS1006786.1 hypothetical protein [Pseudomonas putida]